MIIDMIYGYHCGFITLISIHRMVFKVFFPVERFEIMWFYDVLCGFLLLWLQCSSAGARENHVDK